MGPLVIVHLVGSVDEAMLSTVIDALNEAAELTVRITSEGGDPDIGLAIAGLLQSHTHPVTTEVYGNCYSAATIIFAVGAVRRMQKWAWAMVHETSDDIKDANASTMKRRAKQMERDELHWNSILASLTGTDAKVWEKFSEVTTYLNADECLRLNLATEIF